MKERCKKWEKNLQQTQPVLQISIFIEQNVDNDIMDELLYSYVRWSWGSRADIDYEPLGDYYFPTTERGLEILEYLRDIDLIEQIFDEEEV